MTRDETDALVFKRGFRDAMAEFGQSMRPLYNEKERAAIKARQARKAKETEGKYGKGRAHHR